MLLLPGQETLSPHWGNLYKEAQAQASAAHFFSSLLLLAFALVGLGRYK